MNPDLAMDTERLQKLDVLLNEHPPFGSSQYIIARTQEALRRRLAKVGERVPAAAALADTLDCAPSITKSRTYRDPVLRASIQNAFTEIVTERPYGLGLAHCGEVFHETDDIVRQGIAHGPLAGLNRLDRLHAEHHSTFAWSDDGSDRPSVRAFRRLVLDNFGDPVGSFNRTMLEAVHSGMGLATDVLPATAYSALRHTSLVVPFPLSGAWRTRASGSQFRMTGAVFLLSANMSNPWWVAEHLLHEALHQKLYDIRHSHSLFARDDPEFADSQEISDRTMISIWNVVDNRTGNHLWGVTRAMAAFHVYAHLALFGLVCDARVADLEARYGKRTNSVGLLTSTHDAVERARYLGLQMREMLWEQLGRAGEGLCDWLSDFLDQLGPAASRQALELSLTLERSRREIREVIQGGDRTDPAPGQAMDELVAAELTAIDTALRPLPLPTTPPPQDTTPGATPGDIRRQTLSTIRGVVSRYDHDQSDSVRSVLARLRTVLDDSTRRLQEMPTGQTDTSTYMPSAYPRLSASDREAALVEWTRLLGPRYGTAAFSRFLYSLVRMQRPTTLVELGTGHGVSALWMAHALQENETGHLWTVDNLSQIGDLVDALTVRGPILEHAAWNGISHLASSTILPEAARRLGVDQHLTFVTREIDLRSAAHFTDYAFEKPVDLLFTDFAHGPDAVLRLLGHFLPLMAETASVFIDSASTSWPSYLLLEQVVGMLKRREVPAVLQRYCPQNLTPLVAERRFQLVHITKAGSRTQNATAWLRIEPVDLRPHPAVEMRESSDIFT